jgi:hypothetical protein
MEDKQRDLENKYLCKCPWVRWIVVEGVGIEKTYQGRWRWNRI